MKRYVTLSLVCAAIVIASSALVILPASASSDYWVTRAPIPVAFTVEGAATVNGQIFVFGADAAGAPLTYAYDPSTNTWASKASIPTSRTSFGIVACNNKIYAIGGITGYDTPKGITYSTNVNEAYDPSTDTWTTKAPMPTNRSEIMTASVNGKIYVMGGRVAGAYSTVNKTEIYDPATDSWTTGTDMPYPVVAAASAALDDKIYIVGGQDEFNPGNPNLSVNQIYDTVTNVWRLGQPNPAVIWLATGEATTGANASKRVYVIGGLDSSGRPSAANEIYNPDTDSWISGASFPTTHDYVTANTLKAVNLNDTLYLIGGIARANEGFYEITQQYIPADYNGTVLPEQPIATQIPIATPTLTPSSSISESKSPTPSVAELQWWLIPVIVLIGTTLMALLMKRKDLNCTD